MSTNWSHGDEPYVRLTEKAAQVFKESCEAEGKTLDESFLRVGANPGGCSGYKYELDYNSEQDVRPNDLKFDSYGVNIVVDHTCLTNILGSVEIDYTNDNMVEQGFIFRQMLNGKQCGCGESFTAVKDL